MDEAQWDRLVGDIYAAATDAEGWTALPHRLAPLFSASMCTLWSLDASNGRPEDLIATTLSPEAARDYASHFYASDPWRAQEHRAGWDVALPGSAMVADRVLANTGYYVDFGRLHDTFHLLGSRHQLSSQNDGIVSKAVFCRPRGMEAFSTAELALMNRLIPHLRRAWQMRHQLAAMGETQVRTSWEAGMVATLLALPGAALAVDGLGRILFANVAAERLGARRGAGIAAAGTDAVLQPTSKAERTRLSRALADAAQGGAGDAFLLTSGRRDAHRVVISPMPAQGGRAHLALVLVTPLAVDSSSAAVERAKRMLGLTRAEAEATLGLAGGLSPAEIAEAREVSVTTIRTQLLRAQAKLGVRNLRGLVAAAMLLRDG